MMARYEFRFFDRGSLLLVHTAECAGDDAACARGRTYLEASSEFDTVLVQGGAQFKQQVGVEYAARWQPPATASRLSRRRTSMPKPVRSN